MTFDHQYANKYTQKTVLSLKVTLFILFIHSWKQREVGLVSLALACLGRKRYLSSEENYVLPL